MILSRVAINAEIGEERLKIGPPSNFEIGASSIDLTLSDTLLIMPKPEDAGDIVEPSKASFDVMVEMNQRCTRRPAPKSDPFTLMPGQFVLGWTEQRIELPTSLAGRVEGKSSIARLGLSAHISAPTVNAGYQGQLCLEMYNAGPFRIQLHAGMQIAQLVLELVVLPPKEGYAGQFQGQ